MLARGIAQEQWSIQAKDPPWLWNPGQTSPEVHSGISVALQKMFSIFV